MPISKPVHPFRIRGPLETEKIPTWTMQEHPHEVVGAWRGFEVRVYHYPVDGFVPYCVVKVVQGSGESMDADYTLTARGTAVVAEEMLAPLAKIAEPVGH